MRWPELTVGIGPHHQALRRNCNRSRNAEGAASEFNLGAQLGQGQGQQPPLRPPQQQQSAELTSVIQGERSNQFDGTSPAPWASGLHWCWQPGCRAVRDQPRRGEFMTIPLSEVHLELQVIEGAAQVFAFRASISSASRPLPGGAITVRPSFSPTATTLPSSSKRLSGSTGAITRLRVSSR